MTGAPQLQVPGFEPLRALADGLWTTVWLAVDRHGARVALKLGRGSSDELRARLAREADALRRVGPPHTPAWIADGTCGDGVPYLVMEHLPGETLEDWLRAGPRISPAAIARVGDALLAALAAIHARGIVHGGIAPARLFLRADATTAACALVGFGGAASWHHVAPEQVRGDRVDHRADLYAAGVILYRLATSSLPFDGSAEEVAHGHLSLQPPRAGRRAAISPLLDELIADCLAKDPARRPASAETMRGQLAAACGGATASVPGVGAGRVAARAMAREPIALVLAESTGGALALVDAAGRAGGKLIHQRGRRYLFGFRGAASGRPAPTALAAAADLLAAGATGALVHVDTALVEMRGASPMIYSRAIDDPSTFAPAAWSGIALTAAAAGELDADAIAAAGGRVHGGGDRGPARRDLAPGGEPALAAALDSFAGCATGARPVIWLGVGAPGTGRSRLLGAIAHQIAARHPAARVVTASGRDADALAAAAALRDESASRPVALLIDDIDTASAHSLAVVDYAAIDGPGAALWIAGTAAPGFETGWPGWGDGAARRDRTALEPPGPAAETGAPIDLSRPLAELAEVCALLDPPFGREEVAWIQRALDPAPGEHPIADAGVGLDQLVRAGALARDDRGHRIAWPALRRRLAARIGTQRRRAIHRHAAAFWGTTAARATDAIAAHGRRAHHLAEAGDAAGAAAEHLDRARREIEAHRPADAELSLGQVLALAGDQPRAPIDLGRTVDVAGGSPRLAARALAARGKLRARAGDIDRAVADLTCARDQAAALGDAALEIDALVGIAGAREQVGDLAAADAALVDAEHRLGDLFDARLRALVRAARGRALLRRGDSARAAVELAAVAALPRSSAGPDAHSLTSLLLPVALARAGRNDDAARAFDVAIAEREPGGDPRELAQLLIDRWPLSAACGEPERGRRDLERAIAIAREHALPAAEIAALACLVEDCRARGDADRARALTDRAAAVTRRAEGVR